MEIAASRIRRGDVFAHGKGRYIVVQIDPYSSLSLYDAAAAPGRALRLQTHPGRHTVQRRVLSDTHHAPLFLSARDGWRYFDNDELLDVVDHIRLA